jgi:chromosome partitioning protein
MARKISLINYKGGVGKTSVIVNLAACLAQQGHRVLLVDFDAQSNTSIWLMRLERWNVLNNQPTGSVYSIFECGTHLRESIQRDVLEDRNGAKLLPGLDLIPTTFRLIDLEHDYKADSTRPPYTIFREQLSEIEKDYDFILFDCPPNVLRASQCALFSSNEIYVPSNPDALSLIGFTLFVDKLGQFQQLSASFRTSQMDRLAEVQGIIFNSVKTNVDIEVPKMRMQFRLNQYKNQKKAAANARIFDTVIRDAIIVRRAVTLGLPVILVGQQVATENVAEDYLQLSEELLAQVPAATESTKDTTIERTL